MLRENGWNVTDMIAQRNDPNYIPVSWMKVITLSMFLYSPIRLFPMNYRDSRPSLNFFCFLKVSLIVNILQLQEPRFL
jgi:hypothetical protein